MIFIKSIHLYLKLPVLVTYTTTTYLTYKYLLNIFQTFYLQRSPLCRRIEITVFGENITKMSFDSRATLPTPFFTPTQIHERDRESLNRFVNHFYQSLIRVLITKVRLKLLFTLCIGPNIYDVNWSAISNYCAPIDNIQVFSNLRI